MAEAVRGNLLVAQSGGPTAVINNSVVGVVHEALRQPAIEGIYGALNGIGGVLREDLVDLGKEDPSILEGLRRTPAACLGSIRHKIKEPDLERIVEVCRGHNIRYFLYIGGNDSADTSLRVARLAEEGHFELRCIGIPKTVDNDLCETDHCPGYPSVARFTAVTAMEASLDNEALKYVQIIECMGRDAGWITASAALGKQHEHDGPHIILLPERHFDEAAFLERVEEVCRTVGRCLVAASEGLRYSDGTLVSASERVDAFGHPLLGGVGEKLMRLVEQNTPFPSRYNKAGSFQRSSMTLASPVDIEESYQVGIAAVRSAASCQNSKMVTLVRESSDPYVCTTGLTDLHNVANARRDMPEEFISEDSLWVTEGFLEYARPLVGELPRFYHLEKHPIEKQCTPYRR